MKKIMKWKISKLLMVFALVAAMIAMPVKAGAAGGTIEVGTYTELKSAFASTGGAEIKLMGNIDFPATNDGRIRLESGTFTLDLNGKKINQSGIIDKVGAPISLFGASLTIVDSVGSGEINATQTGVGVFKNSTFILNGGKLQGGWYGLAGNGLEHDTNITINGGSIISEDPTGSAFYHPQRGNLTINGGFIKGATGIQLCSGAGIISAKFSGGTIHGFGEDSRSDKTGDGVVTDGAAISIVDRNYPGGAPSITINGGTFTADKQEAVLAYTWSKDKKGEWDKANEHVVLKGGTYSSDVSTFVPNTHKAQKVNNKYVVSQKQPSIALSETKAAVAVDKTKALIATRVDAITGAIVWTSSNEMVASVNNNGVVTGVTSGTTTITATADGKSATCEVQVYKTEEPTLPTPPTNNGKETTIEVNEKTVGVLSSTLNEIVKNIGEATGVSSETKAALKDAVAQGKQISVEAKTEKVDAKKVDKKEVSKIEKVITKDAKIAQYFDLSMMIQADGMDLGTMDELSSKASFTISVPEDLVKEGRTFYMVRIHNGVAEKISGALKGNDFTFESDKFSLYALVYEDAKIVDTSDTTNSDILYGLLSLSILAMGALVFKSKFIA